MTEKGKVSRMSGNYGYIRPTKGGPEVMFSSNDVKGYKFKDLKQGDYISFRRDSYKKNEVNEVRLLDAV